jgi:8-demethyl-8-alpha-L-rhamnosyltetracenomycin-C 2'-O-methyltransferase
MESVNLCFLAEKYGVDKCPKIHHSYTPLYNTLLSPLRETTQYVLEIGIGNIPLMKPIVGNDYKPGASLRMWRDYFPKAQIVGCDILPSVLFNDEERIRTFFADQSKKSSLVELMDTLTKEEIPYLDIIVDDGSHKEEHMCLSFETLWKYVKPHGGIYIIEDIRANCVEIFAILAEKLNFTDAELIYKHKGMNDWDGFVAFRKY